MVHIIEHIRLFAREAGKPELSSVQVNKVVHSCLDMLGAQFRSRGIQLDCDLEGALPHVSANPFSLEEVILNLLNNALDALEERLESDPTPPRVLISTELEEGTESRVKIKVADNGMGIPEDILARIFDPFFTTKDPDKGTGLGLAISRSIVEDSGGTLQIQTTRGKSTTFIISVPVEI